MSTLLLDIGNSRLKWSQLTQGQRSPQQALAYAERPFVSDTIPAKPEQALQAIAALVAQYKPQRLVVVQVLGAAFADQLSHYAKQARLTCTIVRSANEYGLQLAYPTPEHFGADRFVALLAAQHLALGQASMVIDAGTAVTLDALSAQGMHYGGVIVPGLHLMADSLIQRTEAQHMSAVDLDTVTVFANNTVQAMGSGCVLGLAGALEKICRGMQQQLKQQQVAPIILCGGDAVALQPYFSLPHQLVPDALMVGLQVIAEQS